MGLVSAVVPGADLPSVVDALAAKLAGGPTVAYAAIKTTMAFAAANDLTASLAREAEAQAECGRTEDHRNAVDAFIAKAPAFFLGR
jgi:2-(1,2-epoxy-1,2-dihydrophenyl)acetyl-CoA isomerase